MADDLVKDLRNSGWYLAKPAADRIEQLEEELSIWKSVFPDIAPERVQPDKSLLEARIEKLEAALRTIYECCDETGNCSVVRRIVRKALEEKDG